MQTKSLAFRLIISSALWSLFVLGIAGIILSANFRTTIEKSFDERLQIHLRALIAEVSVRDDKSLSVDKGLGEPRFEVPYSGWYWQIMDAKGELAASSKSLFDVKLEMKTPVLKDNVAPVFSYLAGPEGQSLRSVVRPIILPEFKEPFYFVIAGNAEEIEAETGSFARILGIGLLVLALGMLLALFFQIRFGLRPLKLVQRALSDIRSGKKTELEGSYPSEISPLVVEINSLLKANRQVVERARTHVGNLAHSLKTPLSVLTNEMDKVKPADKKAKMEVQVKKMKDQISHHLDRAQMAARTQTFGLVTDVLPIMESILRTLGQINQHRQIAVDFKPLEHPVFAGDKHDLEEIIGNLLENAFKWAESSIDIELTVEAGQKSKDKPAHFVLQISDDGPGLAQKDITRALTRGKRLDETKPGSGLGLSIVSELVEIYGGTITLSRSDKDGLCARITLPAVN